MTYLFTNRLRHFVERVPLVSQSISKLRNKLQDKELTNAQTGELMPNANIQVLDQVRYTVTTLMFDEMEIACWVRFIDRFNLLEETFSVYDL